MPGEGLTGIIKELWEAANQALWGKFTMLMGGPSAPKKDAPISSATQWNEKLNRYLEPVRAERIGILYGNVVFPTKLHQWRIEFRPKSNDSLVKPAIPPSLITAKNLVLSISPLGILSITVRIRILIHRVM